MTTITAAEISSGVVSARSNLILIWKSTTYIGSHFYLEYYEVFDGTIVRKPFFTEEVYVGYSYINQNYTYNYTSTLNISNYQGKYFVCKLLDTNNSVITQTPRYYINPTPMTPSVLIRTITVPSTTSNYTIEVIPRDNNKIYCNTADGSITEQVRNEQIILPLSNEEIKSFSPGYQYVYYFYSRNEYEVSDAVPLRIIVNTKPNFSISLDPHIYRIPQEDAPFSGGNGTDIINTALVPNINSARSVYSIYRTLVFCDISGTEESFIELDPIQHKSKNENYNNTFYLQEYLKNKSSNEIEYVKFKIKIYDGIEYSDEIETQLFAVTLKLKNIVGYDNNDFKNLYINDKIYKQLRIAYDLDGSININSIEAKIGNNSISIHYTLNNNISWTQTDWLKDKQWASVTIDDENFDTIYGEDINFIINYGNNYINNTYTISKTVINNISGSDLTINNNNVIEIYNQELINIKIIAILNNFKEELKEGTNYFWNRVVSFSSNASSNIIIQDTKVYTGSITEGVLTNTFNIGKEVFLSWENNSNLYLVGKQNNFRTTFTLTVKYIHVLGYEYTIQETYTVSCKKQLTSGDIEVNYNYNNTGENKKDLIIRENAPFKVNITSTLYSPDELTYTFSLDAYHEENQTTTSFNLYEYKGSYSFSGSSSLSGSLITIFNNEELSPLILEVEKQGWNVKYTFKLWTNTIDTDLNVDPDVNPGIEKISEVIGTTYRHVEPMFTIERFKAEFGNTNDEIISEGTIKINTSNDFGFDTETSRQYTWTCSIQDINFNGQNKIVDFGNISNLQFTKVIEQGQTYYKCNFEISKEDNIFEYWKTSELIITLTAEVRTEFDSGNPVTTIKFNKPE